MSCSVPISSSTISSFMIIFKVSMSCSVPIFLSSSVMYSLHLGEGPPTLANMQAFSSSFDMPLLHFDASMSDCDSQFRISSAILRLFLLNFLPWKGARSVKIISEFYLWSLDWLSTKLFHHLLGRLYAILMLEWLNSWQCVSSSGKLVCKIFFLLHLPACLNSSLNSASWFFLLEAPSQSFRQ